MIAKKYKSRSLASTFPSSSSAAPTRKGLIFPLPLGTWAVRLDSTTSPRRVQMNVLPNKEICKDRHRASEEEEGSRRRSLSYTLVRVVGRGGEGESRRELTVAKSGQGKGFFSFLAMGRRGYKKRGLLGSKCLPFHSTAGDRFQAIFGHLSFLSCVFHKTPLVSTAVLLSFNPPKLTSPRTRISGP